MSSSTRSLAPVLVTLAATLVAGLTLATGTATAYTYRDESAGTACQGANGAASKFTYTMQYLTNVGAVDQYIVCDLTSHDATNDPLTPSIFRVNFTMAQAGSTITCVVQTGAHHSGTNHIISSASETYTSESANANSFLDWDPGSIVRNNPYDVLMLNCKVPPGTKVGLIQYIEDNPPIS
jgi:hypothetical protein